MEVSQDIILHSIPATLHQPMERHIQPSKLNYPSTGQYLQSTLQQAPKAGRMGITHLHPLRHGGLLYLKHLHGVKHRLVHGGHRPLVVHGERRPQQSLMVLHKPHSLLGINKPNDPHLNSITLQVHPSIRLLDNPLPQGGLALGTRQQWVVIERKRSIMVPCDDPTRKGPQIASHCCRGLSRTRLVPTSSIMQNLLTLKTWPGDRGIGVQILMPELALLPISPE